MFIEKHKYLVWFEYILALTPLTVVIRDLKSTSYYRSPHELIVKLLETVESGLGDKIRR